MAKIYNYILSYSKLRLSDTNDNYEVYYGESFIIRKYLVSVDGGKAILPIPDLKTNTIDSDDYHFAKLVSIVDRVDDYLKRSKLKVN